METEDEQVCGVSREVSDGSFCWKTCSCEGYGSCSSSYCSSWSGESGSGVWGRTEGDGREGEGKRGRERGRERRGCEEKGGKELTFLLLTRNNDISTLTFTGRLSHTL